MAKALFSAKGGGQFQGKSASFLQFPNAETAIFAQKTLDPNAGTAILCQKALGDLMSNR